MKKKIFQNFVELTGNPVSSNILRKFTQSKLSKPLIRPFKKIYHISDEEMTRSVASYHTLHDFFTRTIDLSHRPMNAEENILVSPADAMITSSGRLIEGEQFFIKNNYYSIYDIFGNEKTANQYKNGYYYILYLSPQDYHHFHHPIDGQQVNRYALGSLSYPVNELGLSLGKEPFHTNYRLITEIQSKYGKVGIVKVGALNVNSIQVYQQEQTVTKGEDFGFFSFGSTVILFIENNDSFEPIIQAPYQVKVRESIGVWK